MVLAGDSRASSDKATTMSPAAARPETIPAVMPDAYRPGVRPKIWDMRGAIAQLPGRE